MARVTQLKFCVSNTVLAGVRTCQLVSVMFQSKINLMDLRPPGYSLIFGIEKWH